MILPPATFFDFDTAPTRSILAVCNRVQAGALSASYIIAGVKVEINTLKM